MDLHARHNLDLLTERVTRLEKRVRELGSLILEQEAEISLLKEIANGEKTRRSSDSTGRSA